MVQYSWYWFHYKMMSAPPTSNLLIIEQKRVVAELVFERTLILSHLEKVDKKYRPITYSLAVLLSQKGIVEKEIKAARQVLKKLKTDDGGNS